MNNSVNKIEKRGFDNMGIKIGNKVIAKSIKLDDKRIEEILNNKNNIDNMEESIKYFEEVLKFYKKLQICFNRVDHAGFKRYIIEKFQDELNIQLDINFINKNKVIFKNNECDDANELIFSINDIDINKLFDDKVNLNYNNFVSYIQKTILIFLTNNICQLIS